MRPPSRSCLWTDVAGGVGTGGAGGGESGGGWRGGGGGGGWGGGGSGGRGAERAVRPMAVVMANELGQHVLKVPAAGDQDPVQALASDGAHEPLGDRVCLRRPGRLIVVAVAQTPGGLTGAFLRAGSKKPQVVA